MILSPDDRVALAVESELPEVLDLYERVGYTGGVAEDDRVLVAHRAGRIVGAVRLCHETGLLVLRGMYVLEDSRGSGVGTALLARASREIGTAESWCVPYVHLMDFYSRIGFREATGRVPGFLGERRDRYARRGARVTVMRRPRNGG